jgi:hypothetical protein
MKMVLELLADLRSVNPLSILRTASKIHLRYTNDQRYRFFTINGFPEMLISLKVM